MNKCGVEGCIAEHHEPAFGGCKCNGNYVCSGHRHVHAQTHKFPKVAKEDEPWFCDFPRRTPCQYPYCDCGRQGGQFG